MSDELMCVADLPNATVPLWQLAQVPVTCAWSTSTAGLQLFVEWHLSQRLLLATCVPDLVCAVTPSWQLEQVPVTSLWSTPMSGNQPVEIWQASHVLDVLT